MATREWLLTIGVIVVPLAIAVIVTLWSLEQARYRPKRKRPPGIPRDETAVAPSSVASGTVGAESAAQDEPTQPAT